jgi:flagellar protein FlgJ
MIEGIYNDLARLQIRQLPSQQGAGGPDTKLKEVSQEFESLFLEQMLDAMRATLNSEDDMFHGGMAEDFFEDMLYQEYARIMSKTGSIGIAELVYDQLS